MIQMLARSLVPEAVTWRLAQYRHLHSSMPRQPRRIECPSCGQSGLFGPFGYPTRPQAQCTNCGSLERHRWLSLWLDREAPDLSGKRILHFAPERLVAEALRKRGGVYRSADLAPGRAELVLDIEAIDRPDGSFDFIMCSHVLEHVDDRKALAEMHRILTPGGMLLLMVPMIQAWERTYENPAIVSPADREIHFGQWDHVRFYGRDIQERVLAAGFSLEEATAREPDVHRYGLTRGENLFICRR